MYTHFHLLIKRLYAIQTLSLGVPDCLHLTVMLDGARVRNNTDEKIQ